MAADGAEEWALDEPMPKKQAGWLLILVGLLGAVCVGALLHTRSGPPRIDRREGATKPTAERAPVPPPTLDSSGFLRSEGQRKLAPEETAEGAPPLTLDVVVLRHGPGGKEPAPGVEVRARVLADPTSADPLAERERETSSEGTATLRFPVGGYVRVLAVDDSSSAAAELELFGGGVHDVELALEPALCVYGLVKDSRTGEPIEGAKVGFTDLVLPSASTDSAGRFELGPLGVGSSASIEARARGYGPERAKLNTAEDGSWSLPARFGHPLLAGKGATAPHVELALVPEKVLSGRIVDAKGTPIPEAEVEASGFFAFMENTLVADRASSRTAREGSFRIAGLRSDVTHAVAFSGRSFRTKLVSEPEAGEVRLGDVVLDGESSLRGSVRDAQGRPLPGILIELFEYPPTDRDPSDLDLSPRGGRNSVRDAWSFYPVFERSTYTDEEGRYRFLGVAPGKVRLTVQAGNSYWSRAKNDFEVTNSWTVLDPFVLERPLPALRGRVARDDRPLAGARVEVISLSGLERGTGTTDAQGRFAVVGFAPGLSYVVRVYADTEVGSSLVFQDRVDYDGGELELDL